MGNDTINEVTSDSLLHEASDEADFDELSLEIEDKESDIEFALWVESDRSYLLYECKRSEEGDLEDLANTIQGLFLKNKRWTSHIPNLIAHPRRLFRSPKFTFGQHRPSVWTNLSWQTIIEGVITRWLSNVLTGLTGFLIGLALGWRFL